MRVTSHKTFMCNKLCNWVFCLFLLKCPALDALAALDGTGALDGIRASRFWTLFQKAYRFDKILSYQIKLI